MTTRKPGAKVGETAGKEGVAGTSIASNKAYQPEPEGTGPITLYTGIPLDVVLSVCVGNVKVLLSYMLTARGHGGTRHGKLPRAGSRAKCLHIC